MIIDNKTVSLLHFDSKDNTLKDELGVTWNNVNGIYFDSGKFNGAIDLTNSGYIYTTDSKIINLTDCTIDFWGYVALSTEKYCKISFGDFTSTNYYGIVTHKEYYTSDNATLTNDTSGNLKNNDWNHFALVYKDRWYYFENGKLLGTIEASFPKLSTLLCIGNYNNKIGSTVSLPYIDELRISNVARWTSDFDVPTGAYTDKYVLYLASDGSVYSR